MDEFRLRNERDRCAAVRFPAAVGEHHFPARPSAEQARLELLGVLNGAVIEFHDHIAGLETGFGGR